MGDSGLIIWRCNILKDIFDIDDITRMDLKQLADHIEEYLVLLEKIMIIPDAIRDKKYNLKKAIKVTKKLIRNLRRGKKGVFKDREDWNIIG